MAAEQLNIQLPESMPILVAIVAAVIQMVKGLPIIAKFKAYLPLVSVGLGIGLAYYQQIESWPIVGAIVGLTASGAYSALKAKTTKVPA